MSEILWSTHAPYQLLALLQLLPLVGALLLYGCRKHPLALRLGWLFIASEMLLALELYRQIDVAQPAFQFAEHLPLLGPFAYHAAADGVTVLFILLTALVVLLIAAYVRARDLPEPGLLFSALLLLESVLISGLATLNLLWFFLASAIEVALAGVLILRWAVDERKRFATLRFYQFQASGLLMLLAGVLLAGWQHADRSDAWSFDLLTLAAAPITGTIGSLVFYLLFYGLAVRTPLFPFHGWLATVVTHGNLALAPAILLGVKLGLYGMIRFVFPIVPEAVEQWHIYAMGVAATGIFYAAFLAFLQDNLRTLMAYAVVSHTSLAIVGLFSLRAGAFQGSVLMAASFGLSASAMFFMTGFIYHRTRSTALSNLGSLIDPLPLIGTAFFIGALAIVGMPGTPGFDAFHLVLEAGIRQFGALPTVGAALANVTAAGFLLWGFQRAFLAPRPSYLPSQTIERATPIENLIAVAAIAIIAICGFYMTPWLDLVEAPLKLLATRFGNH